METSKGIIVVSENGKKYDLPGGAAENGESRKDAALRELKEETGLQAVDYCFLFEFKGRIQRNIKGGFFRDFHKIYLIKVDGVAKPSNEINYVTFYTKDSKVKLSYSANQIIQKYLKNRGLKTD